MSDISSEYVEEGSYEESFTEPESTVDWENKYRSEVADRVKERERYKPIAQTFAKCTPTTHALYKSSLTLSLQETQILLSAGW